MIKWEFLTLLHTMNHDFAIEYIIVKYLDLIGGLPNFPFFWENILGGLATLDIKVKNCGPSTAVGHLKKMCKGI